MVKTMKCKFRSIEPFIGEAIIEVLDMSEAYMSTAEWRRTNMKSYAAQFTYDSGIPDAVAQCAKENGVKEGAIIRAAIVEKLEREGYLNAGKYSGPHGSLKLPED